MLLLKPYMIRSDLQEKVKNKLFNKFKKPLKPLLKKSDKKEKNFQKFEDEMVEENKSDDDHHFSDHSDEAMFESDDITHHSNLAIKFQEASKHLLSHESHSLSEIFIHQLIETIEFVLGTISNTASYLRLWALSLAHSQLAEVFYEKTVGVGIEDRSPILMFLMFPVFFTASFFVLMCMDSMECFLHTLRLHWVEFQNKFYKGNGYAFQRYSLKEILA